MNTTPPAHTSLAWIVAAALAGVALCSSAAAQPNPFDAYSEERAPEPEPEPEPEAREVTPPLRMSRAMGRGSWSLGAAALFSYTTTTNDVPSGDTRKNTTSFLKLSPSLGYFVLDNLEVAVSAGWLSRQLDRGRSMDTSTENALLVEATGRYFLQLDRRFALTGDLTLGGYFGGSTRFIEAQRGGEVVNIEEDTDTSGVSWGLGAGVANRAAEALQLRAGLGLTGLAGRERIASVEEELGVRTLNVGLTIGAFYLF